MRVLHFGLLTALALAPGCGGKTTDDAAAIALGPEPQGGYPPESAYHRPGQPCTTCHKRNGAAAAELALAGTVFWGPTGARPAESVYVRIQDATLAQHCFVTNCAGNFFARAQDLTSLVFPLLVSVQRANAPGRDESTLVLRRMGSHVGRASSCATCHALGAANAASAGQVHLFDSDDEANAAAPAASACPLPDAPTVTQCPEDRL